MAPVKIYNDQKNQEIELTVANKSLGLIDNVVERAGNLVQSLDNKTADFRISVPECREPDCVAEEWPFYFEQLRQKIDALNEIMDRLQNIVNTMKT